MTACFFLQLWKAADKKQTYIKDQNRMQICRIFAPEKKQGHVSPELACCLQVKNIRYEEQTPLSELAKE